MKNITCFVAALLVATVLSTNEADTLKRELRQADLPCTALCANYWSCIGTNIFKDRSDKCYRPPSCECERPARGWA
uniref:Uncharacterized protein n=1 Tax=Plectus sambesii TaxID=2011161 RepID=A0A914W4T0_9BILA